MDLVFHLLFFAAGFLLVFTSLIPIRLWVAAVASGAGVPLGAIVGLRLRRVPPKVVVEPRIKAFRAGLDIPFHVLEAHYVAGGDPAKVVDALISAAESGIDLSFESVAAIDLEGREHV